MLNWLKCLKSLNADKSYREKIFRLAKGKKDQLFYNSSPEHAKIVHLAIIQNASRYVNILCSSMCSEISNNKEYCTSVDRFLSVPEHQMNIVFTDYDSSFHKKPIAGIFRRHKTNVTIKKFDGHILLDRNEVHFTISDDRAFRLENNIQEHIAYGNFNNVAVASSLNEKFNEVLNSDKTQPINI